MAQRQLSSLWQLTWHDREVPLVSAQKQNDLSRTMKIATNDEDTLRRDIAKQEQIRRRYAANKKQTPPHKSTGCCLVIDKCVVKPCVHALGL